MVIKLDMRKIITGLTANIDARFICGTYGILGFNVPLDTV